MVRWLLVVGLWIVAGLSLLLVFLVSPWWLFLTVPLALIAAVGLYDLVQTRHSILRNYPVLGHFRFLLESIRPEIQQYFVERDTDGTPYDRDTRSTIYQRAKNVKDVDSFGTERDLNSVGYEYVRHSILAQAAPEGTPRTRIGGPDCTQPYDMAMYNVSAMSFGSLSANAILALNGGAAKGGFAHDTGEGGLSRHHLKPGGDLIWEIGTGYFGCRTDDGRFDAEKFRVGAAHPQVKCISIKLSQGAKPGLGGVMPGAKVTPEIAEIRGVPVGETVVSPPSHNAFSSPVGLCEFIGRLRELSGGKPVGFKLCVGSRSELLGICKAIRKTGIAPDFIIVDGAEGGTGAAPIEFEDHVGMPLTQGLMTVHNALVGTGLRGQIRIGASGKVTNGVDIVKRVIQGADFTLAARAMMMAVGCIQSQECHTNKCPVGVATQDARRGRAVHVPDKTERVYQLQRHVVDNAKQFIASMGLQSFDDLHPSMLMRTVAPNESKSYAEIYEWLEPGQLLEDPPDSWLQDWEYSSADAFVLASTHVPDPAARARMRGRTDNRLAL
ncbi:FMN-binding glutamate synthase family protein [Gordonia sp. (in: high G+C Gram-positive bacteria)]|uniref:FMN-binding glutamate synthase family protein n=1 Tax=Gordonia sp. (in: high G+C Gram-positive bacteria) TaxID=84139 RepID=UPI00168FA911|nr:FMN-binding glutamate synthase family protein [Gordonia sp. (in: high G+C Gram-positive bacteria)]NLG47994.1 FMN-binding glutamate synthase family protein [Gordonia sp. (in: high G+C Gram-positive bacteria)]